MEYQVLSDKEAKRFALGMREGQIFTDRHLPPEDEEALIRVFMVLALADEKLIKELQEDPPGMIFEYVNKAGPMACNGLPMFMSAQFLSQESTELVNKYLTELERWENEGEEGEN